MLRTVRKTRSTRSRTPLHLQIAGQIRKNIHSGEFPPGSKLPTNQEFTKTLGVSPVTVQNAIRTLSAEGLVVPRRRVGTFVSDRIPTTDGRVAIMMRGQPARDDVVQWHYVEAVAQACQANRLESVLEFYSSSEERFRSLKASPDQWSDFKGILLVSPEPRMLERLATIQGFPTRLVALSAASESPVVSSVMPDNFAMCYELVQRLHALGHRRIGFVRPTERQAHLYSTGERIRGFRYAANALGLDSAERIVDCDTVDDLFAGPDRATAIILAIGLTQYGKVFGVLDQRGLSAPQDISIIGYDATDMELPDGRKLSAVEQPFERVAQEAARHLAVNDDGRFQVTIPQTFVEGDTIGPAR